MNYLYLGPGVGGGVLAVIIGVVILILITIFTFVWFPIKRYLKKEKIVLIFLAGFVVTVLAILFFLKLKFISSINHWILETSQFVYYSGHPLLNDDEIFEQIKQRFKNVASSLFVVILKTLSFILVILVLVGLTSIIIDIFKDNGIPDFKSAELFSRLFPNYLLQLPFILGSLIPLLIVPFIKNKNIKVKTSYSAIDKLLHYIFLGNKNISQFLFRIEIKLNKKTLKSTVVRQNVYISGMARAGTTVLMQYLGELEEFKSLSYKNLPFLFLPKTWPRLIVNKKSKEKERFHQDGVMHSLNSYEALEEPFFRNNLGKQYIKEDIIVKHELNQNLYKKYNSFRRLLAGNKIYLAKNNNHLLRAESLHQFDDALNYRTTTIIPIRNPLNQAKSLLKQHKLLSKLQQEDNFTLDYMDFLVHHEFGLHTKTLVLQEERDYNIFLNLDKDSIDYWLEVWYFYYKQVFNIFKEKNDFYFFCYDSFVSNPKESLELLLTKFDLSKELINSIDVKKYNIKTHQNTDLIDSKYLILYNKLKSIAINNYGQIH